MTKSSTLSILMAAIATVVLPSHLAQAEDDVIQFSLERSNRAALISTPDRIRHSLAKFGLEAPAYFNQFNKLNKLADSVGAVNLTSAMVDIEYIGKIYIGNPLQEFNINFDTGSSDIWVPAIGCRRCGGRNRYDLAKSTSFMVSSKTTAENGTDSSTWQVRYADGSGVSGTTGFDTITVGDLTIENRKFGLVSKQANGFSRDPFLDGLFGLAFPQLSAFSNTSTQTIVQDLYDMGKIKEPIVGIWLGRTNADKGVGEVMFGSSNSDHYDGELQYIPIERKSFWSVPIKGLNVNGINVHSETYNSGAVLDSGTTLLVVPSDASKKIHAAIPGASFDAVYGWRMPCDSVKNHTNIMSFKLGDYDFPFSAADLVRESSEAGDGLCYSGVVESKSPMFILGDTFLKKYYSVFDYTNARVGLALSK